MENTTTRQLMKYMYRALKWSQLCTTSHAREVWRDEYTRCTAMLIAHEGRKAYGYIRNIEVLCFRHIAKYYGIEVSSLGTIYMREGGVKE